MDKLQGSSRVIILCVAYGAPHGIYYARWTSTLASFDLLAKVSVATMHEHVQLLITVAVTLYVSDTGQ